LGKRTLEAQTALAHTYFTVRRYIFSSDIELHCFAKQHTYTYVVCQQNDQTYRAVRTPIAQPADPPERNKPTDSFLPPTQASSKMLFGRSSSSVAATTILLAAAVNPLGASASPQGWGHGRGGGGGGSNRFSVGDVVDALSANPSDWACGLTQDNLQDLITGYCKCFFPPRIHTNPFRRREMGIVSHSSNQAKADGMIVLLTNYNHCYSRSPAAPTSTAQRAGSWRRSSRSSATASTRSRNGP
jgi:hypothetical protein